jgi:hypothetical protein
MSAFGYLAAFGMLAVPAALSWLQFRGFSRERKQR